VLKGNGAFQLHYRSTQHSSVFLAMTNTVTHKDLLNVRTRDKWVTVTTAWRVLRLRMEERPPIWRAAASILNKLSRTADKGWYYSFTVGRGAKSSRQKLVLLWNSYMCLGPGLILWYDQSNGKRHEI
jgi:hypothetical protein